MFMILNCFCWFSVFSLDWFSVPAIEMICFKNIDMTNTLIPSFNWNNLDAIEVITSLWNTVYIQAYKLHLVLSVLLLLGPTGKQLSVVTVKHFDNMSVSLAVLTQCFTPSPETTSMYLSHIWPLPQQCIGAVSVAVTTTTTLHSCCCCQYRFKALQGGDLQGVMAEVFKRWDRQGCVCFGTFCFLNYPVPLLPFWQCYLSKHTVDCGV